MQVKTPDQKRTGLREVGNRYSEKRRGARMNSRVRVRVEWDNAGQRANAEAFTRVVNPYGCMVILKPSLELDQRLSLTKLATGNSNASGGVWERNARTEGGEYGIELLAPDMDFWGMEL